MKCLMCGHDQRAHYRDTGACERTWKDHEGVMGNCDCEQYAGEEKTKMAEIPPFEARADCTCSACVFALKK